MSLGKKIALMFGAILFVVVILAVSGYVTLSQMMGCLDRFSGWSDIDMVMNESVIQTSYQTQVAIFDYVHEGTQESYDAFSKTHGEAVSGLATWRELSKDVPELVKAADSTKTILEGVDTQMQTMKAAMERREIALAQTDAVTSECESTMMALMFDVLNPTSQKHEEAKDLENVIKWNAIDMLMNEEVIEPALRLQTAVHDFGARGTAASRERIRIQRQATHKGLEEWRKVIKGEAKVEAVADKVEVFYTRIDNQVKELEAVFAEINSGELTVTKSLENLLTLLGGAMEDVVDPAKAGAVTEAENSKDRAVIVFAAILALLLATGTTVAFILSRNIIRPIRQISAAADTVAAGDLTVEVTANGRKDEVGILARAMAAMVENLRTKIKMQAQEISEGANLLAASTAQMSASVTQVTSNTAETAAAVSEATATVEESKQTAQLSAQKAKEVSENAQNAVQISQSGLEATKSLEEGMSRITSQMDTITNTVMGLSEQSQAIGEIISTVDEIAEQSNLLAVNAAVEAARAGEQGKGFGVVAQEIRSLSEQSKEATKQVRGILNTIQKATSAAVMATEQGSKVVEEGLIQSAETARSIQSLSQGLEGASGSTTQIAASSQQQLVGMDQVVSAMESIKDASNQSADSMKQLETEMQNLKNLSDKLAELTTQYQT